MIHIIIDIWMKFIWYCIAGTPVTITIRSAILYHKIIDYTMKYKIIIKIGIGKIYKIPNRNWN